MTPFAEWTKRKAGFQSQQYEVPPVPEEGPDIPVIVASLESSIVVELQLRELRQQNNWQIAFLGRQDVARETKYRREVEDMERKLATSASRALAPLLAEGIVKSGIAEFCAIVRKHAEASAQARVTVQAPEEWREELNAQLTDNHINAEITVAPTGEMKCQIGAAEIETDLLHWVAQLRETALV